MALATLALGIFCLYAWRTRPGLHPDLERYLFIAEAIRAGAWSDAVNYHYPPLFPALIALAGLVSPSVEFAARAVGLICAALTVVPLYLLSRRVFGPRSALLASGFFMFRFLPEITICEAEQVMLLFATSALLAGIIALERKRLSLFLLTGAVFGAGFLVKPEVWAYFLLFGLIAALVMSRSVSPKTSLASRLRPAGAALAVLAAGYFTVAGPYLLLHYRDTGQFSFNPKARTLFMVHNVLYLDFELYKIKVDDDGPFTFGQRIYIDGDKKPMNVSIPWVIWSLRKIYFPEYFLRLARSFSSNLNAHYLMPMAPWIWPLPLALGLWPLAGRERQLKVWYLHAFALVPVLTVPLFSMAFPRFYFGLVPWLAMILGRGVDRGLELTLDRGTAGWIGKFKAGAAPAIFALLFLIAAVQTIRARPDEAYWNEYDFRAGIADWLKNEVPAGCRFMGDLNHPSYWFLAGFPPATQVVRPVDGIDRTVTYAQATGARYLIFYSNPDRDRDRLQTPLLDPNFSHPKLQLRLRRQSPAGDVYVIYEVLNTVCPRR